MIYPGTGPSRTTGLGRKYCPVTVTALADADAVDESVTITHTALLMRMKCSVERRHGETVHIEDPTQQESCDHSAESCGGCRLLVTEAGTYTVSLDLPTNRHGDGGQWTR